MDNKKIKMILDHDMVVYSGKGYNNEVSRDEDCCTYNIEGDKLMLTGLNFEETLDEMAKIAPIREWRHKNAYHCQKAIEFSIELDSLEEMLGEMAKIAPLKMWKDRLKKDINISEPGYWLYNSSKVRFTANTGTLKVTIWTSLLLKDVSKIYNFIDNLKFWG